MNAPLPALELVKRCCRALDEKKAEDLRVLDVSELVLTSRAYSFDDLILTLGREKAAAHFARIKAARAEFVSFSR